ncbi:MAG: hypothetical protein K0R11_1879 [Acidimicrobiales bacterium]|nr:hypothetical protein [Acidimicrobiales bacterium]
MAQRKKRTVTDSHKAAMAQGRTESRAISAYLEALEAHRPKRGRKRTPESIDKRLATIDATLESASPVKRLSLIQERLDLLHERESLGAAVDLSGLEDDFVSTARSYGERKGISYAAWRELGVAAPILKRAGITRSAS